ncbi:alkaline phosphatase D family protein [Gordonia sp. MP11Mi]|uniref:Phospholipase D n=1 Tax=Gordonia sp. MP11Mi TaxID=3022769 RepID=A0AA97CWZ5_9ACTN
MNEEGINRRLFLRAAGGLGAAVALQALLPSTAGADTGSYFHHGVASGDPLSDSVLLWTRVTPTSDSLPGTGSGPNVDVKWEVSSDRSFRNIVAKGSVPTGPYCDHTVKVIADGLQAGSQYHYRFSFDDQVSPVGSTKTTPADGADVAKLKLAVASCANFESGYFAAYRHMAADNPDMILFLGDYIYEYKKGQFGVHQLSNAQLYNKKLANTRFHEPENEIYTLADYRTRYAQYRRDPDLQEAHRRCPWFVTWDDHDIADNTWSGGSTGSAGWPGTPPQKWSARKKAAHQAFFEWMPIRDSARVSTIYRSLRWGNLAEIPMLDLRSFRTKEPATVQAARSSSGTITGAQQMAWLQEKLSSSVSDGVQWRIVGNPVVLSPHWGGATKLFADTIDGQINPDQWTGYQNDRGSLLNFLGSNNIDNVVFVTGDIHSAWGFNVPGDQNDDRSKPIAAEFVSPSITSDSFWDTARSTKYSVGPSSLYATPAMAAAKANFRLANHHLKFVDLTYHGYGLLEITHEAAEHTWNFIENREFQETTVSWRKKAVVEDGIAGLKLPK